MNRKEVNRMAAKMTKVLIHVPQDLKKRLDSKRREGYSLSGFVRGVLERELNPSTSKVKKGA